MPVHRINQKIVILEPLQKYGLIGLEACKDRYDVLSAKTDLTKSEQSELVELKFALEKIEMLEL